MAKKPPARYISPEVGVTFLDRFPDLDSPKMREALGEFLRVCEEEGQACSAAFLTVQLSRCKEMGRDRAEVALRNSAERRLRYVAEPVAHAKGNGNGGYKRPLTRHQAKRAEGRNPDAPPPKISRVENVWLTMSEEERQAWGAMTDEERRQWNADHGHAH